MYKRDEMKKKKEKKKHDKIMDEKKFKVKRCK